MYRLIFRRGNSAGETVDDTLAFHWSRIEANEFAVLNGISISAVVPEPNSMAILALGGLGLTVVAGRRVLVVKT